MTRLRVTGGRARGRVLREPVPSGVRPTTDRVREALFSIVGQDLAGRSWLDAYGGTGIVGLEAWSRGASVTIVERSRRAWSGIRRRGEELGADWTVVLGDVERKAVDLEGFDLIFADPPYAMDPVPIFETLVPLAREMLILETATTLGLPPRHGEWSQARSRSYGRTILTVYRRD